MNGNETFCGQTKSISLFKSLSIHKIAEYRLRIIHSHMYQYRFILHVQLYDEKTNGIVYFKAFVF